MLLMELTITTPREALTVQMDQHQTAQALTEYLAFARIRLTPQLIRFTCPATVLRRLAMSLL